MSSLAKLTDNTNICTREFLAALTKENLDLLSVQQLVNLAGGKCWWEAEQDIAKPVFDRLLDYGLCADPTRWQSEPDRAGWYFVPLAHHGGRFVDDGNALIQQLYHHLISFAVSKRPVFDYCIVLGFGNGSPGSGGALIQNWLLKQVYESRLPRAYALVLIGRADVQSGNSTLLSNFQRELTTFIDSTPPAPIEGLDALVEFVDSYMVGCNPYPENAVARFGKLIADQLEGGGFTNIQRRVFQPIERLLVLSGRPALAEAIRNQSPRSPFELPQDVWRPHSKYPLHVHQALLKYWMKQGGYFHPYYISNHFTEVFQKNYSPPSGGEPGWNPRDAFVTALNSVDWSAFVSTASSLAGNVSSQFNYCEFAENVRNALRIWLAKYPQFVGPEFQVLRTKLEGVGRVRFQSDMSFDESIRKSARDIDWDEAGIDELCVKIRRMSVDSLHASKAGNLPITGIPIDEIARGLVDQGKVSLLTRFVDRSRDDLEQHVYARLLGTVLGAGLGGELGWTELRSNAPLLQWCIEFIALEGFLPEVLTRRVCSNLGWMITRHENDFFIGAHQANSCIDELERIARRIARSYAADEFQEVFMLHPFATLRSNTSALYRLLNSHWHGLRFGTPTFHDLERWIAFLPRDLHKLWPHQLALVMRGTFLLQQVDLEKIRRLTRMAWAASDIHQGLDQGIGGIRTQIAAIERRLDRRLPRSLIGTRTEDDLVEAACALPWYQRLWYALPIYRAIKQCVLLGELRDHYLLKMATLNRLQADGCLGHIRRFSESTELSFQPSADTLWLAVFGKFMQADWYPITDSRIQVFVDRLNKETAVPKVSPVEAMLFRYRDDHGTLQTKSNHNGRSMSAAWSAWLARLLGQQRSAAIKDARLYEALTASQLTGLAARAGELASLHAEGIRVLNARAQLAARMRGEKARFIADHEFPDELTDLLCGVGDRRFTQEVLDALTLCLPVDGMPDSAWARAGLAEELASALARLAECLIPAEHAVLSTRLDAWQRQWDSAASIEGIPGLAAQWQLLEQQRGLLLNLPHATDAQLRGELFDERQQARLAQVFAPLGVRGKVAPELLESCSPLAAWLDEASRSLGFFADAEPAACAQRLRTSAYAHLVQFFAGRQGGLHALVLSRDEAARRRLRQAWGGAADGVIEEGGLCRFSLGVAPDIADWLAAVRAADGEVAPQIGGSVEAMAQAAWMVRVRTFLEAAQPAAVVLCPELAVLPWESLLPPGCFARFAAVSHFGRLSQSQSGPGEVVFDSSGAANIFADQAERRVVEEMRNGKMCSIHPTGMGAKIVDAVQRAYRITANALEEMAVRVRPTADIAQTKDLEATRTDPNPLTRVALAKRMGGSRWVHLVLHGRAEQRQLEADRANSHLAKSSVAPKDKIKHSAAEQALRGPSLAIADVVPHARSRGGTLSVVGDGELPAWFLASLRLPGSGVFLSSCEAGLMLPAKLRAGGEALPNSLSWFGIAPAFAAAGANLVIAPLWRVNQLPNFLFVRAFYGQAIDHPESSVAAALAAARGFVKGITVDEIRRWLELYEPEDRKRRKWLLEDCGLSLKSAGGVRPFASPYYWAGYTALGDARVPLRQIFGDVIEHQTAAPALRNRH